MGIRPRSPSEPLGRGRGRARLCRRGGSWWPTTGSRSRSCSASWRRPRRRPPRPRAMLLFSVQVDGVPSIHVEEALLNAPTILWASESARGRALVDSRADWRRCGVAVAEQPVRESPQLPADPARRSRRARCAAHAARPDRAPGVRALGGVRRRVPAQGIELGVAGRARPAAALAGRARAPARRPRRPARRPAASSPSRSRSRRPTACCSRRCCSSPAATSGRGSTASTSASAAAGAGRSVPAWASSGCSWAGGGSSSRSGCPLASRGA